VRFILRGGRRDCYRWKPFGKEADVSAADKRTNWWLFAIFAVGFALRLPNLGYSFYGDEGFSVVRDSLKLVTDSEDRFRPIFFSLLYLWRQVGFHGEVGLRLLPLLFGLAQIPLAFLVGRKLRDEKLGFVLAMLVAASPLLIEFSQELRMYSLVGVLALLQMLTFLQLIEKPSWLRCGWFTTVAVIGVYTHLHYWIFLAGFALSFIRERRAFALWKGWAALATTLVLYLPNLSNIAVFAAKRAGDYAVHLPSALPKLLAAITVGFNYFLLPDLAAGRPIGKTELLSNLPLVLLVAVPALMVLWSLIKLHVKNPRRRELALCHELFTVPVLLTWAISIITNQYWLQPKYIIFIAYPALLFVALGYIGLSSAWWRRLAALVAIVVCVIALTHFWDTQHYGRRENWREAARTLERELTPTSVIVAPCEGYTLLSYYWPPVKDHWQQIPIPPVNRPTREFLEHLHTRVGAAARVYYLWYDAAQNASDPHNLLRLGMDYIGLRQRVTPFNPRLRLYEWSMVEARHFP
jgi:uncharacterized membrane protein